VVALDNFTIGFPAAGFALENDLPLNNPSSSTVSVSESIF
jgi:hypothetical protein